MIQNIQGKSKVQTKDLSVHPAIYQCKEKFTA